MKISDIGDLPGTDFVRTILFCGLTALILFVLCGPLTPEDLPLIYRVATSFLLISGIAASMMSAIWIHMLHHANVADIRHPHRLLYPKILLQIGTLIVFAVISFWVVVLGGILQSPFGTLVVISPVFFVLNFVFGREIHRCTKLMIAVHRPSCVSTPVAVCLSTKEKNTIRTLNWLNWSVLALLTVTVVLGEYFVKKHDIHLIYRNTEMAKILTSDWRLLWCYVFYYISFLATILTVMPRQITLGMTRKYFL